MPWRCSSLMMRPSVQLRLCFGLPAFAVFVAGLLVSVGAEVVVVAVTAGAVATAGAEAETAGGRSTYFGASAAGATSLICVVGAVAVVPCGAAVAVACDRLRSTAWA